MVDVLPWVVRFVDKPDAGRVTRFDLNSLNSEQTGEPVYVRSDGFSLGTSERLVAMVESMLREGGDVVASKRANREVVVPLAVVGAAGAPATSADLATVINAVAREADRESNYLEFQPSDHTGESVFFVVKQGDIAEVELDSEDYPDQKGAQVTLLCEPTAIGAAVTGSAVVNNDAAAVSNPLGFSLPAITGDVAAPFNVTASGSGLTSAGATALLSVHTKAGATGRVVLQAEAATRYTDTTLAASNDAALSGSGNNYVRTSFATNTLIDRLGFSSLNIGFGTYKVLARVRKATAGDAFDVRRVLYNTSGGTGYYGPTKRYGATTSGGPHWLDLGEVGLPAGPTPPGVTSGVVGDLRVQAQRITGSGTLDFDAVVLVPTELPGAPDVQTSATWLGRGSSGLTVGFNADDDEVWTQSGTSYGYAETRRGGSLPQVHPGLDNHVVFARHVDLVPGANGTTPADDKTWATTLAWSYRPRWLYLSEPA